MIYFMNNFPEVYLLGKLRLTLNYLLVDSYVSRL